MVFLNLLYHIVAVLVNLETIIRDDCGVRRNLGICPKLIDRAACPVGDRLAVGICHDFRAVVHCLIHCRRGCVDVLTPAQGALKVESGHSQRKFESEFKSEMTLVDACHRKVGEGVL